MKIWRALQFSLMALILTGLLAACATTPPPSSTTGDDQGQVQATDVSQQPDVKGVDSSSISSQDVADHLAIKGLKRVHFDFDQFTLTNEARVVLKQNAAYLQANSGLKAVIEGHCDERGSDEYNLALGERRASAAKQYLVSLGVNGNRLSIISYGEEKALDAQSNEQAWAKNRRAEFKAIK
ncbi:MAG: peptidoglycan-associated lipoprotein Pal [Desulfuromonadales bacterium]|nr:peptidoglycan-associated lipoprotein Pal [Desulfuromonadales bacterium]